MALRALLKRNTYYDSITLMSVAQALKVLPGVEDAGAVMATEMNRELLRNANLFPASFLAGQAEPPGAEDLLIVVRASNEAQAEAALANAQERLSKRSVRATEGSTMAPPPRSLEMALRRDQDANLAVISVAGEHAWLEAEQALRHGLHVFLFSDNVPLEQEKRLKTLAVEKGLLLMGPDCGTALINGVALGFCNVVPRGNIGIAGASGTGMQQIMCQIAEAGCGISQAIGVGGRDLSPEVGGIMMRQGLAMLAADPQTEMIVLVSKPPAPEVARSILDAAQLDKPVVAVFLSVEPEYFVGKVPVVPFLATGADQAVGLARGEHSRVQTSRSLHEGDDRLRSAWTKLLPEQRYIRALYSGGTLCEEAMLLLSKRVDAIASNIPLRPEWALAPGEAFRGHTALDLGADEFTRGRPHPMIDPTLRLQYIERTAEDPQTAVILLDIILGFCSHPDPAAIYVPAIREARARAEAAGRFLPFIVSLCGTEGDPQHRTELARKLNEAGALVYTSNAVATIAAAALVEAQ